MGVDPELPVSTSGQQPRHQRATVLRSQYLALLALAGAASIWSWVSVASSQAGARHVVPMHAKAILAECAALQLVPTIPLDFSSRQLSDRYEPNTDPIHITNATIWTGNNSGKEVISRGEVVLDNGIIKYIGKHAPVNLLQSSRLRRINANEAWVTPSIVDMHSHLGVDAAPGLNGNSDTNSFKGITQPWLRSLDGIDTHDAAYRLSVSGGVSTSLVLPGSANAIGGQAFVIKLRETKEKSPLARVLEPPYNLLNGTRVDPSIPPRWRHMKHAAGENPSRVYSGTRMDTIWAFRAAYNEARKLKLAQDEYCAKAEAGLWTGLPPQIPADLKWEALVDVLRGRVKVNIHIYETVDFTGIVGLSKEFEFPIAAFHHAHEAYLVPEVINQTWGGAPGVAIFATNARYKRESYRGSEFAAKILHESGLRVAMKSDHPVLNSRFLLYEAAQAHYFGLEAAVALAAVTSTPADLIGMGHRIGYLRKGYDADLVIWDSHPLSLGATPKQVFIDGIAQLDKPHLIQKPHSSQHVPETPSWDHEAKEAVEYDGLPPLNNNKSKARVVFHNVRSVMRKTPQGAIESLFESDSQAQSGSSAEGVVVVSGGEIDWFGPAWMMDKDDMETLLRSTPESQAVDLKGGSIIPGLLTFGSGLGVVEIGPEPSTNDGLIYDPIRGTVPSLLQDEEIQAIDGLSFGGRNQLLAYRSGVTAAITPPTSNGVFGGISAAYFTGAAHKLQEHAVIQKIAALHVGVGSFGRQPSVSSQIAALRKALLGGLTGPRGEFFKKAAEGSISLVVDVDKADHIATLLELKREVDAQTGHSLRLVLSRATEAHLLAEEISDLGVGVILSPPRQFPESWSKQRILPGPPLTPQSALGVLLSHNVTLGLGIVEEWEARNQRFDLAWAALESNGTVSKTEAISLASSNLEKLLGLEVQHDLVAYEGGDALSLSSRPVAVLSPSRAFVELF